MTAPLNAAEFNADEGIREGRQKGSNANMGRPAATGRVEYVGYPGLTVGASAWTGRSGFEFRPFRPQFDVPMTLIETDARYARGRVDLRGQFAQIWLDNAGRLNDTLAVRIGVNPNIARSLRGFYAEAGYRVISGARFGDVGAFVRYEDFDTQFKMPRGYVGLPEFNRDAWVIGSNYWPHPDIVVKADSSVVRSRSSVIEAPDSFNLGLGWWF